MTICHIQLQWQEKAGVGKTTLTGMMIQYLADKKEGPILAVDADANSNLNEVLGVDVEMTLGDIRDELSKAEVSDDSPIPKGMSKQDYTEFKFDSALVEEDDYDLLVMGHTQGKGCYCFVNGLLSAQVGKRAQNYKYIVVDNEAGMEHISRGILPGVDAVILVQRLFTQRNSGSRTHCTPDSRVRTETEESRSDRKPRSGRSY